MDNVIEMDSVLQLVRQSARRFGLSADTAVTQQILLIGDAFYGYRYTSPDFTAVWSAADQTLKMHDINGRVLEIISPPQSIEQLSVETIALPCLPRKAA